MEDNGILSAGEARENQMAAIYREYSKDILNLMSLINKYSLKRYGGLDWKVDNTESTKVLEICSFLEQKEYQIYPEKEKGIIHIIWQKE